MFAPFSRLTALALFCQLLLHGGAPAQPAPELLGAPTPAQPDAAPEVPGGVEVLARGPVHEAFATPTGEARPTQPVGKKPPAPIEELPPEEKPEGDVAWIAGYYAWDDDRQDFLWVSGCWRAKPPDKEWVPGYWREIGEQWQWAPGFWAQVRDGQTQPVTYYPEPPAPPQIAPPGDAPQPDQFFVPGYWMWTGERYAWRAGYWTRGRPGYVYVASHYRWTPSGYVFTAGYWDYSVAQRGLLYAPIVVNPGVVGARFVYTPAYAVTDTIMLDALFVRPVSCHYYFGDYYGPRYATLGFESCVVYSRRCYEPIFVTQRWNYRHDPGWLNVQINLTNARNTGRAPLPPRTLVQQNTVINNVTNVTNVTNVNNTTINKTVNNTNVQKTTVLAPAKSVLAAKGQTAVPLSAAARSQVQKSTQAVQQSLATDRRQAEAPGAGAATNRPRAATFSTSVAASNGGAKTLGGTAGPQNPQNPNAPHVGTPTPGGIKPAVGSGAGGLGQPAAGTTKTGTNPMPPHVGPNPQRPPQRPADDNRKKKNNPP